MQLFPRADIDASNGVGNAVEVEARQVVVVRNQRAVVQVREVVRARRLVPVARVRPKLASADPPERARLDEVVVGTAPDVVGALVGDFVFAVAGQVAL